MNGDSPDRDAAAAGGERGGRSDLARAIGNMVAKAGSLVVERGAQLAMGLVAARMLGVVAFGQFSFAASLTALLAFGTDLGLTLWTTRALARDPTLAVPVLGTTFRLRVYAMAPYFACLLIIAIALGPGAERAALLPIGIASLARTFLDHARAVFRAHERIGDEGKVNAVVASLAALAGIGLLAITRRGLPAFAIGVMAGTLAGTVYGFWLLGREYGRWTGTLDRTLARAMLRESLPFWLSGIFALAYSRGDVVVLRAVAGDAEVGAYRLAGHLYEVAKNVPVVVMTAMFPQLARYFNVARARLRRTERGLALSLLAAGVLSGLVLAATANLVAGRIFGPGFTRAVPVLHILALALPIVFTNSALTHFLVARDLGVLNFIFAGVMVPINVGANLWLSRRLGAPGAAWSTLITEASLFLCCAVALRAARRDDAPEGEPLAAPTSVRRAP